MRPGFIIGLMLFAATSAWGDFTWFNTTTSRITYASGGANFLAGNKTNPAVGCFVQLVFAGTNQTNDVAVDTGTGVSADDVVVSNFWIGVNPPGADGYTVAPTFANDATGRYFVRVWTAPSDDFTNGIVPLSPTNFYGDSALFQNPLIEFPLPPAEFQFGGSTGFATLLKATVGDSDADGLPNWWEYLYFGNQTSAVASTDAEPDGQNNLNEYRSGTDPTNAASVFELASVTSTGGAVIVQWSSVTGKVYTLSRTTNLIAGFSVLATNIAATPPMNVYTDAVGGVVFFSVGTE